MHKNTQIPLITIKALAKASMVNKPIRHHFWLTAFTESYYHFRWNFGFGWK